MPIPPVVVEIAAQDAKPALVATLIAACSRAVEGAGCVAASEDEPVEQPTAVAIVSWKGDRQVRIQVGFRRRREWRVRYLEFDEDDALLERWRAVGYATGTLAGKVSEDEAALTEPGVGRPFAPGAAQPPGIWPGPVGAAAIEPAAEPDRGAPVWVEGGFLVGPGLSTEAGLDSAPWRIGVAGRVAYSPASPWPFFLLSVRYSGASEDDSGVEAAWLNVSLGGGYPLFGEGCAVCVDVRAEALAQWITVKATERGTRFVDDYTRRVGGLRAGVDLSWMATPAFGLVLGADAAWLGGSTDVRLHSSPHSSVPTVQYAVLWGLRWRPR